MSLQQQQHGSMSTDLGDIELHRTHGCWLAAGKLRNAGMHGLQCGDQAPLNAECSSPCLQSSQAECDVLFLLSLNTDQGQDCTQPFKP